MLALKVEAGRKDRLLHLLATISVGIEKKSQFDWDQAVSRFGWQPHCVFATSEPLSNQKETVKRVFLNLKILILWVELLNDFPYWSDSGQQQQQSHFYIIDKGTYHNKDTRISKCYKKGLCFGLTKVLLAEGDASFPFAGHCHISLRRTLLLRKVMLAQRQRELQEEITSWTLNMSSISRSISIATMSIGIFQMWQ